MNEKIRVLHVIRMNKGSGTVSFLMNYFRHIDRTRISFSFLSDFFNDSYYEQEILSHGGNLLRAPYYKHNIFNYIVYLNRVIRRDSFDIIHSHDFILSIVSLIIAKKNGIKIRIIHSHSNSIHSIIKKIIVVFSRNIFKIFATDFFSCSAEAGIFLFGKKNKSIIINNAIDVNNFLYNKNTRKKIREKLQITDDVCVLGFVGRFSKEKNHVFLIDVFNKILKTGNNSILLLVGEGDQLKYIKKNVIDLQIFDKVIFHGITDKVYELYAAMDIFIFPSLYEGLGIVGIEAQCSGLPVIASKNIPKEMQISGLVTWLSLSDGPEKWADTIIPESV